jgi:hypothetical protein
MTADQRIASCDRYLGARTGKYQWRRVRYLAALNALLELGVTHNSTVMDVGAGWTEFDYCLRTDGKLRSRYIPVDGCIDGTDLETWTPSRDVDFVVALELVEHLERPQRLVRALQEHSKGIVISTPNPETTDVLGMDETHRTPIHRADLIDWGFTVERRSFYGQPADSLFAVWS